MTLEFTLNQASPATLSSDCLVVGVFAAGPLAGYPADVMAARLRSTTINFSVEEPRDDIAILVLRNDA